jgi:hypothetical protein
MSNNKDNLEPNLESDQKEISNRDSNIESSSTENDTNKNSLGEDIFEVGYFCKICGEYIKNYDTPQRCTHCHIPVCNADISCSFCLNCYVKLNNLTRGILKFSRIIAISSPFFLVFLILYNFLYYIIFSLFLAGVFIGLYYYQIFLIRKKHTEFFPKNWEDVVHSKEYQELTNEKSSRRFIPQEQIEKFENDLRKYSNRKQEDQNFIASVLNTNKENVRSEDQIGMEKNEEDTIVETQESSKDISSPISNAKIQEFSYNLIGKACPLCGKTIEFADFCPDCNRKFCPKCGFEYNPYSTICVCGFRFPNLIEEFKKKYENKTN